MQINGKGYENSILFYAEDIEYNDDNIQLFFMWQTILSVLASFIAIAYEEKNAIVPADIENINPDEIDDFFTLIQNSSPTPQELFDYFCQNVCY